MRRLLEVLVVVGLWLCTPLWAEDLVAADRAAVPATEAELRVGVLAPLVGDYASGGEEIRRGIQVAQAQLGEENIPVQVFFEDVCLPAQAVAALKKLVTHDRIEAVVSNYCVIALNAFRPIIEKQRLITFQNSSAPAALVESSQYIYSTWPSIEQEVEAIAEVAGPAAVRRMGIVYLDSPWGLGYAEGLRNLLMKRGLTPSLYVSQGFNVHDFRAEVARIRAAKSAALFVAHAGAQLVSFLKQAQVVNFPGDAIFVPSDNDDVDTVRAAGAAAEGISLFSTESPHLTPMRVQFQERYEKLFSRKPGPISRHAYDQLLLVARAMHECKKDLACAHTRLQSTRNFDGASGTFSMTARRLPERVLYRKQVRDGKFGYPG